jgi:hypothetical protein
MLNWWSNQGQVFMRACAGLAVIFGVFIVYVVATPRKAAA